MSESADGLSTLSDVHGALGATRRCHAIRVLAKADDTPLQAATLANQITAIEEGIDPTRASGEPYRNVYNALCQTHLPALADLDIIRYDSTRKTLTTGPQFFFAHLLLGLTHTTYRLLLTESDHAMRDPSIGD